ncbi:uncharacterized protein LOC144101490 [Amblyomma americanum]
MPRGPSSDNYLVFLVVRLALNSRFCTGFHERRDSRDQPAGFSPFPGCSACHASSRRHQLRSARAVSGVEYSPILRQPLRPANTFQDTNELAGRSPTLVRNTCISPGRLVIQGAQVLFH